MNTKNLPNQIPVFPLTGTILLPRAHLPLNIFEPRYKEMVEFAIDGDGIIGMVQPLASTISTSTDNNDQFGTAKRGRELYKVGCAGLITEIKQTTPQQYFIILTGIKRFEIQSEMPQNNSFREVLADYSGFALDSDETLSNADNFREKLFRTLERYLSHLNMRIDLESFDGLGDEELINSVAMILPFEASEKQLILESKTLEQRTDLALQIMNFNMANAGAGAQNNIH